MEYSSDLVLDIHQKIAIQAEPAAAFRALLRRLSSASTTPDQQPMPLVLEAWPGGRWYRDLGNDQGHYWGVVQVIKAPTLLEICGPMFMSYPVAGHIQFRVTAVPGGVDLVLRHRALGLIEPDHRLGVVGGWQHVLVQTKAEAEQAG